MKSARLIGIDLTLVGALTSILGFGFWWHGTSSCASVLGTNVVCTEPSSVAILPFYLATAGSSLLFLGIWKTGVGKDRIVAEGSGLVISTGLITLTFGLFLCSFLPNPSTMAAGIGYFLGLIGSGLLTGGLVKLTSGKRKAASIPRSSNNVA